MDKERIYRLIAWAASGLMILFGVLLLVLTASWRGLNKNIRSLETMLADAVKETAQLKSEIKELADNSEKLQETGVGEVKANPTPTVDAKPSPGSAASDSENTLQAKIEDADDEAQLTSSEEEEGVADLSLLNDQLDDMLVAAKSAAGGKWSVYIKNLNSKIPTGREESPMRAASLIKLFIMGAVYEEYDSLGQANSKETLDNLLNIMITVSDNDAANQLVTMLGDGDSTAGRQVVTEYCREHGFSDTSMGRMLLEESPTGENYTSVKDCGEFLETIYLKEFDHWEEMLKLLKAQQRRSKIPAKIPDGVEIANKTGELSGVENDAAIVFGDKNPYIICFMTDGLTAGGTAVEQIAEMSGRIYGFFNQ